MRTHLKFILLALTLSAVLWLGLAFVATSPAQAHSNCANRYVVRYGDWLAQIARANRTSVGTLLQLNPELQWNPDLIYPGQILCLPGAAPVRRTLALEATYEYAPQQEILVINGKRVTYNLTAARVVTDSTKLDTALKGTPAPAALIVKNTGARGYALFEVSEAKLTASTQITPTAALNLEAGCNAVSPVNNVIVSMEALTTTLEVAIEREDGVRVPLDITHIGLLDQSQISSCLTDRLVAILFPNAGSRTSYWALVPGKELQGVVGPSPWYIYYYFFWGSYSYY